MAHYKTISKIIRSNKVNMGGFLVDQPLPHQKVDLVDPFILIHHADHNIPTGGDPKTMGVGPHPHRGFSPITMVFKGGVHHRDSRSNDSVVLAGGVQWMNAGLGIIHSERPPKELAESGGQMEIIQFWVNLPQKLKMVEPSYFPLSYKDIPIIQHRPEEGEIRLIAGYFKELSGPIEPLIDLLILRIDLKKDQFVDIPVDDGYNVLVYSLNGQVIINNSEKIDKKTMIVFGKKGKDIHINAYCNSQLILLAGKPLDEQVVKYGPYVMNTDKEIWEAMRDYQMGKMGHLVEEF